MAGRSRKPMLTIMAAIVVVAVAVEMWSALAALTQPLVALLGK